MNTPRFNSVDEALASLPRARAARRATCGRKSRGSSASASDAVVEFQPRPARRSWATQWPLALAASLAVSASSAPLCWSVLQERAATELVARSARAGRRSQHVGEFRADA